MRLVFARCTVDYEGRLTAHLPEATRLIMVKSDGCVAIHADGGAYKPLNWMNAPNKIVEEKGLKQESDPKALESLIDKVIAENPDKVKEYKSGKEKLFGFFVGQAMKVSNGKANPKLVNDILKKKL